MLPNFQSLVVYLPVCLNPTEEPVEPMVRVDLDTEMWAKMTLRCLWVRSTGNDVF